MKKMTLLAVVFLFTFSIKAQKAIHEFDFNGSFSNAKNDVSFSGNATFVNDRTGVPNRAIRVVNSYIEATVLNLPVANSSRTVSVWVKYNDLTKENYIWGYGSSYNARYFGLIQQKATDSRSSLNLAGSGDENDISVTTTVHPDTWYNYTVTYDGLTSKIYKNGELIRALESPRKLTSGIIFSIGKKGASVSINADIDDLRLYDVALSDEEVVSLYKGNPSLTGKNVVTYGVASKTEQVKKTVTIPFEGGGIRSSEVFTTKGARVFLGNKVIDISSIPEGTYFLLISKAVQKSIAKTTTSDSSKIGGTVTVSTIPVTEGVKSSEIVTAKGIKVFAGNTNVIDVSSIPVGAYSLRIINTPKSNR